MATLGTQIDDGIATVTLDRPEASNAVNEALRSDFIREMRRLNEAAEVRAIVLTGAGRSFCAGQDLREAAGLSAEAVPAWQAQQRAMYQSIRELDKPCVAALNGAAAGAGFQVALCADLRVAHAGVKLGQPEVKAGIASIVGSWMMTQYLSHAHNVEMSLLGELVTGQRALELGLLNHVVPQEQVLARALEIAERFAQLPANALRLTKERFRALTQAGFDDACEAVVRYHRDEYATGEPQEIMRGFLEARARKKRPQPQKA